MTTTPDAGAEGPPPAASRSRRPTVVLSVVGLLVGAVVVASAFLLDLGPWTFAAGVALVVAGIAVAGWQRTTTLRVVALTAAAAVAATGWLVVRHDSAGWRPDPEFTSFVGMSEGVVVTEYFEEVTGWDAEGDQLWTWEPESLTDAVVVVDDAVVVQSDLDLVALDIATGEERWEGPVNGWTDPVAAYDDVLVMSTRSDDDVVGIDVGTGEERWRHAGVGATLGGTSSEPLGGHVRRYESPFLVIENTRAEHPWELTVVDVRTGEEVASAPDDVQPWILTATHLLVYEPQPGGVVRWRAVPLVDGAAGWTDVLPLTEPYASLTDQFARSEVDWLSLDLDTGELVAPDPPGDWLVTSTATEFAFDGARADTLLVRSGDTEGVWRLADDEPVVLPSFATRLATFTDDEVFAQLVEEEDALGSTVHRVDLVRDGEVHSVHVDLRHPQDAVVFVSGEVLVIEDQDDPVVVPLDDLAG